MEERKWLEVTFYLRPHLLEYVTSLCGPGPLVLDPYHIIGLTVSTCLRRTARPVNGAIRAGRMPLVIRLSLNQSFYYGRRIGGREIAAFERSVELVLQRELIAYTEACRARGSDLTLKEAIFSFLDSRNMSMDHVPLDSLYAAVESHDRRAARQAYKRNWYLGNKAAQAAPAT